MEREDLSAWISSYGISGLVQKKWIPVLESLPGSWEQLKEFPFPILDTFGMERAQVTMGGIPPVIGRILLKQYIELGYLQHPLCPPLSLWRMASAAAMAQLQAKCRL